MKITRIQLRQIIKEELNLVMKEATRSKPWAWQQRGSSIPGRRPDYGEGNLTISDVQELFPSPAYSRGEQDDIWEKYKHLNNAGELKAAILGL